MITITGESLSDIYSQLGFDASSTTRVLVPAAGTGITVKAEPEKEKTKTAKEIKLPPVETKQPDAPVQNTGKALTNDDLTAAWAEAKAKGVTVAQVKASVMDGFKAKYGLGADAKIALTDIKAEDIAECLTAINNLKG